MLQNLTREPRLKPSPMIQLLLDNPGMTDEECRQLEHVYRLLSRLSPEKLARINAFITELEAQ